ncbi:hypothetical protein B0T24DRAFT_664789 [Lasiosphaeria ovina]|uniref:Ubiquitin-like domain-containing protein n=1 Tax=Lasiosphaeria ovina TaxID=92902 RepID=A0AAE0N9X4_9PEZI|nr:hypothetical protein B0T24DRAFT_664789 [Lasiosphaeria ovina]
MSFGFSVGDFVAVGQTIGDIISCLRDSSGSKADYQELIRELETLNRALQALDRLPGGSWQRVKKYEGRLGPRSSSGTFRGTIDKISWMNKADDVDRLRKYLGVHLGTINIMLLEHGLQALDVSSRAVQGQYDSIQERVKHIDTVITTTSNEVQGQGSLVRVTHNLLNTVFGMVNGEIRSSLTQIACLTQSTSLLAQRIFDSIANLQMTISANDTRWTHLQSPVKVEDALGRQFPMPSEYSIGDLLALIQHRFREGPGQPEVTRGKFNLFDRRNSVAMATQNLETRLLPGLDIVMSIIIEGASGREETMFEELDDESDSEGVVNTDRDKFATHFPKRRFTETRRHGHDARYFRNVSYLRQLSDPQAPAPSAGQNWLARQTSDVASYRRACSYIQARAYPAQFKYQVMYRCKCLQEDENKDDHINHFEMCGPKKWRKRGFSETGRST